MRHGHRLGLGLSIASFAFALPQTALAGDEIEVTAPVTATAGWASNPFSQTGSNLGSSYVQLNAQPKVSLASEHNQFSLSGDLSYLHYFRDYSDTVDTRVEFDYVGTLSERLNTHAHAYYDSTIVGGIDSFSPVADPTQTQPLPPTGSDLALYGTRTRRQSIGVSGDTSYALSAHDSLTANAFYTQTFYPGQLSVTDFKSYGGGASYARTLSEQLKLGVQLNASSNVYKIAQNDSQVYSVQGTVNYTLNSSWNVSAALGTSFAVRSGSSAKAYITGNLQACRVSERTVICVTLRDAVLPTGVTGTVDTMSAGATYSYSLTEHSKLLLSGTYTHNSTASIPVVETVAGSPPPAVTPAVASSFVTTTASYERTLTSRLHFVASTHFSKVMGGAGSHTENIGGTLGITVRLGDYR